MGSSLKEPVKVNDVINIDIQILKIGNSSVTAKVTVVNTKSKKEVVTCEMVFVHVDTNTMKSKEI